MTILAHRLTRLIEAHADQLVESLEDRIARSQRCEEYRRRVDAAELKKLVSGIYSHLGQWLVTKTEEDIERRYTSIGIQRAEEGVPVSQLLWCIMQVKENLWEFLRNNENLENTAQIFGELVLTQMVDQFFDQAVYFAVRGHETTCEARMAS
jgi:hypothetical protein